MRIKSFLLAGAAMALIGGAAHAQSNAFGALSNFDVFNDDPSGRTAEGFEIELEGVHAKDVAYSFSYDRFGAPTYSDYDNTATGGTFGAHITYAAKWNGSQWTTAFPSYGQGTPAITPSKITATMGHDCVAGAPVFLAQSACEHFGVGVNFPANPTAVRYHWLVDSGNANHDLTYGAVASVPGQPAPVYIPPAVPAAKPQVVEVQRQVEKPDPASPQFGEAKWVKIFTSYSTVKADLNQLLTDNKAVPQKGASHWVLLQRAPAGVAAEKEAVEKDNIPKGKVQVTKRYEFYAFTGVYDSETHEALCDITTVATHKMFACDKPVTVAYTAPDGPTGTPLLAPKGNLGNYQGANMVGFNLPQ